MEVAEDMTLARDLAVEAELVVDIERRAPCLPRLAMLSKAAATRWSTWDGFGGSVAGGSAEFGVGVEGGRAAALANPGQALEAAETCWLSHFSSRARSRASGERPLSVRALT